MHTYLDRTRMPRLADPEDEDAGVDVDDPAARPLPRGDEAVPVDE